MRSFFYNLDKMFDSSRDCHNKELYSLCLDVKEYVMTGTFTRYKKAPQLLRYWGETDKYTSSMIGMKEGTIRVTRRNLSNELYEIFGYDFFTVIGVGDSKAITEGRYRLSLAKKGISADNFLYRELIDDIVKDSVIVEDINIKSCALELQFLIKHSRNSVKKELSMLDKNKLAFLIRMLNNEEGSVKNIHNLVRCFEK